MSSDRCKKLARKGMIRVRLTQLLYQRVGGHQESLSDLLLNLVGSQPQKHR